MDAELTTFVREALVHGVSREGIRAALAGANWRAEEIDAALAAWADSDLPVPVPRRRISTSAGEAFLYLVLFATLYISTFDVGAAWWALIERWFPDVARSRGVSDLEETGLAVLRWTVAGILIAFPVFLLVSRAVLRALRREPEKRASGVRRWLTYLTLFVAAMVLIGDLVVLVTGFLNGELTRPFLLRALVVFLIASAVFGHYLGGLRHDERAATRRAATRWIGPAGAIGTVVTLIVAMSVMGSPREARVRQLDQIRVRDLAQIAGAVSYFHRDHHRLPATLAELDAPAGGPLPARDPVSGAPYEYVVQDSVTFLLGATFASEDSIGAWGGQRDLRWRHPAGHYLFTRHP